MTRKLMKKLMISSSLPLERVLEVAARDVGDADARRRAGSSRIANTASLKNTKRSNSSRGEWRS